MWPTAAALPRSRSLSLRAPASRALCAAAHCLARPTFATPQRAGEPAWHRRARRKRGDARAWLRVAAASRVLAAHHSCQHHGHLVHSAMPYGSNRGKGTSSTSSGGGKNGKGGGGGGKGGGAAADGPQWDCHMCGLPGNFGWRLRCRGCEAIRKGKGPGSVLPAAAELNKNGHPQSLAERQVRQLREEQRKQRQADEEEKRQLREALARMRAETEERKGKAADEDEGDVDGDEMDVSASIYSSWTEEERRKKLEETRGGLAYLTSEFGEESEQACNAREKIAAIQRASRDAKPFKAHRGLLERKRERLKEKQARDEAEVARVTAELEELETKRKTLRATMDERSKQINEVEGELAEVVKRALAEGDAAGEAGRGEDETSAPWSAHTASLTLQSMAAKPGVPPEFAALLGHVFRAAQALASATASTNSSVGPSAAEGGECNGHRSNPQQQQQPQQPRQPQHPAAAAGPNASQAVGTGTAAAATGGKGNLSGEAAGPLAPQGRWAKGASSGAGEGSKQTQQQQQRQAGDDEMQVDAAGPSEPQTTAGGDDNGGENSDELVEEEVFGSGIDEGVAASINKLPMADQKKLKAALGARGGRRRTTTTENESTEDASGGRDRERSPRPTKGNAGPGEA